MKKPSISIVGGGACALMLGCELNTNAYDVSIYEANAALGRKFLVAGDGGLNLTHSEDPKLFIDRYTPSDFLSQAFSYFNNNDLVEWFNKIGIKTFKGTSGRIFPERGIKPVDVLNIILEKIRSNGVAIHTKHKWIGISDQNGIVFETTKGAINVTSDIVIFCLGGASWPVTGSTGGWTDYLRSKNIQIEPFVSSNCAYKINWSKDQSDALEGKALKNISVTCQSKTNFGEVVLSKFGIEGSGIYPLSPCIREELKNNGKAEIRIDLKPSVTEEKISEKLNTLRNKGRYTEQLKRELNLNATQIHLIKSILSKEDFFDPSKLARIIKALPLTVIDSGPITDAISTVGGISRNELDENFQLIKWKDHYAIGEMLDYDAPTGGYLLQSCFSMAKYLADVLNTKALN